MPESLRNQPNVPRTKALLSFFFCYTLLFPRFSKAPKVNKLFDKLLCVFAIRHFGFVSLPVFFFRYSVNNMKSLWYAKLPFHQELTANSTVLFRSSFSFHYRTCHIIIWMKWSLFIPNVSHLCKVSSGSSCRKSICGDCGWSIDFPNSSETSSWCVLRESRKLSFSFPDQH